MKHFVLTMLAAASLFVSCDSNAQQENCCSEREVEWYADKLCVTPKYLSQVTQRVSHLPASEWIEYFTTHEIIRRLEDHTQTLNDIVDAMHFSSASFFTRYVRKHLGKTPSEIRNKQ